MLIKSINNKLKEKIMSTKENKSLNSHTELFFKKIENFEKRKSSHYKEYFKSYITTTVNFTKSFKEHFKDIQNNIIDTDFLIQELLKFGIKGKGIRTINLILQFTDLQLKEEQIEKIFKIVQRKDSKYIASEQIINTILENQENIKFLMNDEYLIFKNLQSLFFISKNKKIKDKEIIEKLLIQTKKLSDNNFDFKDIDKMIYQNILKNQDIDVELLKKFFPEINKKENEINRLLSNPKIDSNLLEYMLNNNLINENILQNNLNAGNLNLSKNFLKTYDKLLSDSQILRNLSNDESLNYIKILMKKINFKENNTYLLSEMITKKFDFEVYEKIYHKKDIKFLNDTSKETEFNFITEELKEVKDVASLKNILDKEELFYSIRLNSNINHLIIETNIPEKIILKYKLYFECIDKMNTNKFQESDRDIKKFAKHQYLPQQMFNDSFINDCIESKNIEILSKQIRNYKDYEKIKKELNDKELEKEELIVSSMENYYFLNNLEKKELMNYIDDICSIKKPIKMSQELIDIYSKLIIEKEIKAEKEIKTSYGLSLF